MSDSIGIVCYTRGGAYPYEIRAIPESKCGSNASHVGLVLIVGQHEIQLGPAFAFDANYIQEMVDCVNTTIDEIGPLFMTHPYFPQIEATILEKAKPLNDSMMEKRGATETEPPSWTILDQEDAEVRSETMQCKTKECAKQGVANKKSSNEKRLSKKQILQMVLAEQKERNPESTRFRDDVPPLSPHIQEEKDDESEDSVEESFHYKSMRQYIEKKRHLFSMRDFVWKHLQITLGQCVIEHPTPSVHDDSGVRERCETDFGPCRWKAHCVAAEFLFEWLKHRMDTVRDKDHMIGYDVISPYVVRVPDNFYPNHDFDVLIKHHSDWSMVVVRSVNRRVPINSPIFRVTFWSDPEHGATLELYPELKLVDTKPYLSFPLERFSQVVDAFHHVAAVRRLYHGLKVRCANIPNIECEFKVLPSCDPIKNKLVQLGVRIRHNDYYLNVFIQVFQSPSNDTDRSDDPVGGTDRSDDAVGGTNYCLFDLIRSQRTFDIDSIDGIFLHFPMSKLKHYLNNPSDDQSNNEVGGQSCNQSGDQLNPVDEIKSEKETIASGKMKKGILEQKSACDALVRHLVSYSGLSLERVECILTDYVSQRPIDFTNVSEKQLVDCRKEVCLQFLMERSHCLELDRNAAEDREDRNWYSDNFRGELIPGVDCIVTCEDWIANSQGFTLNKSLCQDDSFQQNGEDELNEDEKAERTSNSIIRIHFSTINVQECMILDFSKKDQVAWQIFSGWSLNHPITVARSAADFETLFTHIRKFTLHADFADAVLQKLRDEGAVGSRTDSFSTLRGGLSIRLSSNPRLRDTIQKDDGAGVCTIVLKDAVSDHYVSFLLQSFDEENGGQYHELWYESETFFGRVYSKEMSVKESLFDDQSAVWKSITNLFFNMLIKS